MKMIKALVCALSLLAMTTRVSAGTVMAVLAGVAVTKPLQNEASKTSQKISDVFGGYFPIYRAFRMLEQGGKSLPVDGSTRLKDALKQTAKSAGVLGIAAGAVWVAAAY